MRFAERVAWNCPSYSCLSALVPLYLFETKQDPDEGYIRHALSYFPTITPWPWTTTILVPCLPLGHLDPAYVPQYCQWATWCTHVQSLPTSSICTVRDTFLYLLVLDILRTHPIYKAFVVVRQLVRPYYMSLFDVCGFLPSMIPFTFGMGFST